ncbi:MAG: hypothetical protein ABW078_12900 [Sedimenticola sp.]
MQTLSVNELAELMKREQEALAVIVFQGLAGDAILISPPGRQDNTLLDSCFHKGDGIVDTIAAIPGKLSNYIISHPHLDHFATGGKIIDRFEIQPESIFHSGLIPKPGFVPRGALTSCAEYAGLEVPLWHQYIPLVCRSAEDRWRKIPLKLNTTETEICNLLPAPVSDDLLKGPYGRFNLASTPVGIWHEGKKIVIASDIAADQFGGFESGEREFLSHVELFIPASHGRPAQNPVTVLKSMAPKFICISDSFPDSDFRGYYRDALQGSPDVRSVNIDGTQVYLFTQTSTSRYCITYEKDVTSC